MASTSRKPGRNRIDATMASATEAMLETRWFRAERLAGDALLLARRSRDFERMARILLPLQEARRQRLALAFDHAESTGGVRRFDRPIRDDTTCAAGCWLVAPPNVGADARRLRLATIAAEVPAVVLCAEPPTRAGLWPVVATSTLVLRARVPAPRNPRHPESSWAVAALEALGDVAIASAREEREGLRRVDALLARLDAHPDHEKLHQVLAEECRVLDARVRSGESVIEVDEGPEEAPTLEEIMGDDVE